MGLPVACEIELSAGRLEGYGTVNKFGRSSNVDSAVATDIWDGANATDDIDIWVAPTQARVHNIASSSASDDGDPVGVGARTLRLYGLTNWDTAEVSEDITLNGTTDVATSNSYVIIHRLVVLTKGATSANVGKITATAVTDNTVTAQITAGEGQTQMAIYGLPSTQAAYMTAFYASVVKAGASPKVSIALLVNPEPDSELLNFLLKDMFGLDSTGTSYVYHRRYPYFEIVGPAIIKLQGNSTGDNTDVWAGFDLILKNN